MVTLVNHVFQSLLDTHFPNMVVSVHVYYYYIYTLLIARLFV